MNLITCISVAVYKVLYTAYTMEDVVSDITGDDLDFLKCAGTGMNQWSEKFMIPMNCNSHKDFLKDKLMKQSKDTLV